MIDCPDDVEPHVIIKSSSGEHTVRTLNVGGKESHRCTLTGHGRRSDG
jgi:hypothetical protein